MSSLDLTNCTAAELSDWLLKNRFHGVEKAEHEVVSFLLESVSALPNAQGISDELMQGEEEEEKKEDPETIPTNLGAEKVTGIEISMVKPRGKVQVTFYESGIRFVDKNGDCMVVKEAQHMVVFPVSRNSTATRVLLVLEEDVSFRNKPLRQICFTLPSTPPPSLGQDETKDSLSTADAWLGILTKSLSNDSLVARVSESRFRSYQEQGTSTTTGGLPSVQCYCGKYDGVLYPLEEGLFFCSPPLYIPRGNMKSIECSGGAGGSRYVTLQVQLESTDEDDSNDPVEEFTNIHRDELDGLQNYIHETLIPAMKKDAAEGSDEEEDEEEETVYVEAQAVQPDGGRAKRKASAQAQAMNKRRLQNDEDEDDEDSDDEEGDDDYQVNANEKDEDDGDEEGEEDDNFVEDSSDVTDEHGGADTESEDEGSL